MFRVILILLLGFPLFSQDSWEIALPGKIISNPIELDNHKVALICDDRRVYTVDSKNGNILWKNRPGGKLLDLQKSPDDSLIVVSESNIYNLFKNGSIRWSVDVKGIKDIDINQRGDIYVLADELIYVIDRFGKVERELDITAKGVLSLNNYLILAKNGSKIETYDLEGNLAWSKDFLTPITAINSFNNHIYVALDTGYILTLSNSGEIEKKSEDKFESVIKIDINHNNEILLITPKSVYVLNNKYEHYRERDDEFSLYLTDRTIIKTYKDWRLSGDSSNYESSYYPSGFKQITEENISKINIRVWGDNNSREYYRKIVSEGQRSNQKKEFDKIEEILSQGEVLVKYPNFYHFLILASSNLNPLDDCRRDAYRVIAKSKDITFKYYLMSDLINEDSYLVMPYILYSIGQLSVDSNGDIMKEINRRMDDYYDEKIVINSVYALYYINRYNNNLFIDHFYKGVEKVITGNYSRKIENQCYKLLDSLK